MARQDPDVDLVEVELKLDSMIGCRCSFGTCVFGAGVDERGTGAAFGVDPDASTELAAGSTGPDGSEGEPASVNTTGRPSRSLGSDGTGPRSRL